MAQRCRFSTPRGSVALPGLAAETDSFLMTGRPLRGPTLARFFVLFRVWAPCARVIELDRAAVL